MERNSTNIDRKHKNSMQYLIWSILAESYISIATYLSNTRDKEPKEKAFQSIVNKIHILNCRRNERGWIGEERRNGERAFRRGAFNPTNIFEYLLFAVEKHCIMEWISLLRTNRNIHQVEIKNVLEIPGKWVAREEEKWSNAVFVHCYAAEPFTNRSLGLAANPELDPWVRVVCSGLT